MEALKDADYVFPVTANLAGFAREYRQAGGQATLIGNGAHLAALQLVHDSESWDEIDGMLFLAGLKWWNQEGELIDLTRDLLSAKHSGSAEEIMRAGTGYLTTYLPYIMLGIIQDAVETVGPGNVDSQALYDAAASFSLTVDGVDLYSFDGKTIRSASNYYVVFEGREAEKDLFAVSGWLPLLVEP